jgi:hypothetical protein
VQCAILDKLGFKNDKSADTFAKEIQFKEVEFDLILLDGVHLGEFTLLDKLYLEKFSEATSLSLSMTGLQNLKNLPSMPNL